MYLRDTSTGTTELVSRSDGSSGPFTSAAYPGGVSDDGRFVSFKAYDNENVLDEDAVLGFDPGLNGGNIYVRDTVLNETSLVSRASGCNGAGANGLSFGDSISANGRFVAFNSASSNLSSSATAMTDGGWPVIQTYVRDLWFNTTTLVSRRSAIHGDGPANGWGSTGVTSISNSGRRVGFSTDATNLDSQGTGGSFVRDLDFHTTKRIAPYAAIYEQAAPIISGDGYHALYVLGETYERNLWTGNVELVSRATGAGPNEGSAGYSSGHAISGDGRYVAFSSDSAILNTSGDPTIHQVYVRDLYAGTTTLVSRRAGSEVVAGDDWSDYPTISDNGQYVGFNTWAPNLLDDDLDVNNMWRSVQAKVTYP
ncbi:MAG: hypothetical protein JHC87_02425 [Thermoleophilaceae bacterium]|nr:hypothetical protein [Thermoleophilaceae bacterium]